MLSRNVITQEHVRMFSQRARAYVLAYHKIRQEHQLIDLLSTSEFDDIAASRVKVKKSLRQFKTHRCAMDFDSTFCTAVFLDDFEGETET